MWNCLVACVGDLKALLVGGHRQARAVGEDGSREQEFNLQLKTAHTYYVCPPYVSIQITHVLPASQYST